MARGTFLVRGDTLVSKHHVSLLDLKSSGTQFELLVQQTVSSLVIVVHLANRSLISTQVLHDTQQPKANRIRYLVHVVRMHVLVHVERGSLRYPCWNR